MLWGVRLVRQVIQYHKLKGKPEVEKTGVIDSVPDFLRDMYDCAPL